MISTVIVTDTDDLWSSKAHVEEWRSLVPSEISALL